MKPDQDLLDRRRERAIARLLRHGTWLASAITALGLAMDFVPAHFTAPYLSSLSGEGVMKAGIALFILLPVARVALMLGIFVRERDYSYAAIAALVLAIIALGVLFGR